MKKLFAFTMILLAMSPFDPQNTVDIAQKSCYTLVPKSNKKVEIKFKLIEIFENKKTGE